MSDLKTKKMAGVYIQTAPATMYLAGKFQASFFESQSVEMDMVRGQEEVSVVIQDVSAGYRMNSADDYTNKEFTPPVHKEAGPVNTFKLLERSAGQNPFDDNNFQAKAIARVFGVIQKNDAKIRRAIELQASQVLQTGIVSLPDQNGNTLFTIDYKPKATHFPTSGVVWDQPGDDKVGDLQSLAKLIRADGLSSPGRLDFGDTAWSSFIQDSVVQNFLDNRGMSIGQIAPEVVGEGATFMGWIWLGSYRYQMWTYPQNYNAIQGGASTPYIAPGKVIMTTPNARLDLMFGAVPMIVPPDSRVLPFMPSRVNNVAGRMDIQMNAWVDAPGENLFAGSSSRPLCVPTAIDTYGCLTTGL